MATITWSVDFEVCVEGVLCSFWDLSESDQKEILRCIECDSYSGIFEGTSEE